MGSTLSAWCDIKTPGMSFPNAGEKGLLQAPGVAKPSISHLLPSRWAISSYLCTGYPKNASSSRMVPHRKGGPECRNTMPPSEISQAETQQLLSSHSSPPNSAHTFHGPLGLPCADTTTDKFRLKKSINTSRRHQETTYTVQGGVGLPRARQPHRHSLADQLPVIQKSRHIWKKKKEGIASKLSSWKKQYIMKNSALPYLERFLLLNPLVRIFLLQKSSELSRYKFSCTTAMFYLADIFL